MDESMFVAAEEEEGVSTEPLEFGCPRCGAPTQARYWGPCPACREELVRTLSRERRHVDVEAYEPKMNVTPNQVATKD